MALGRSRRHPRHQAGRTERHPCAGSRHRRPQQSRHLLAKRPQRHLHILLRQAEIPWPHRKRLPREPRDRGSHQRPLHPHFHPNERDRVGHRTFPAEAARKRRNRRRDAQREGRSRKGIPRHDDNPSRTGADGENRPAPGQTPASGTSANQTSTPSASPSKARPSTTNSSSPSASASSGPTAASSF